MLGFLGVGKITIIAFAIMGTLLVTISGAGLWYYKSSQETMKTLNENNANLETAVDLQIEATERYLADIKKQKMLLDDLGTKLNKTEESKHTLESKLAKHDLEALSRGEPKLVETRVNIATKAIFDELARESR